MFHWVRRYPVKAGMLAALVAFTGLLVADLVPFWEISSLIKFTVTVATLVTSLGIIIAFFRDTLWTFQDGRITSPSGLVVGIWLTYLGILLHAVSEELPEAILARLDAAYGSLEHDSPTHWVHHLSHDLILAPFNLFGSFFILVGAFLILLASQKLSSRFLWLMASIFAAAFIIAQLTYTYGIVPYVLNS